MRLFAIKDLLENKDETRKMMHLELHSELKNFRCGKKGGYVFVCSSRQMILGDSFIDESKEDFLKLKEFFKEFLLEQFNEHNFKETELQYIHDNCYDEDIKELILDWESIN